MKLDETTWGKTSVTNIALAFEHAVVCDSLRDLLEVEKDFHVVGTVLTGGQAIELCRDTRPDIMIVDLDMADMNNPGIINQILRASSSTKVMVSTMNCTEKHAVKLLLNGVSAFIPQNTPGEEFPQIVRQVISGTTFVPETMRTGVISNILSFSRNQF